ncbi:Regulator of RpoS [Methylobacterium crusticola]|uniref:Regulator of RpoS n=1 Tax=Methylobacterium crusticola TaxID=1697972 RepID=A0ABQ4QSG6_9HYPH|nr:response regulator [Methylobacterium crusticola]GJD47542.1 Regulator of RpoS [Methylobacterium crusticola]
MSSPLTVLIADADDEMRRLLADAIRAEAPDATVREATNGVDLQRALERDRVDLVFVDVVLPQTDGAAIARWRAEAGRHSMVILVSDLLSPRWPSIATHLGAYDVLLKPVGGRQVRNAVEACRVIRRTLSLLVVDPNRATRAVIRRLLDQSHFSFEVVESEGGRRAVNLARRRLFDIAIIDMALPDYPALEVACQIQDRQSATKLIMMGVDLDAETSRFDTFGIAGLLRKPFHFVDIDRTVHAAFGLWRPYLINALQAEQARAVQRPPGAAQRGAAH